MTLLANNFTYCSFLQNYGREIAPTPIKHHGRVKQYFTYSAAKRCTKLVFERGLSSSANNKQNGRLTEGTSIVEI